MKKKVQQPKPLPKLGFFEGSKLLLALFVVCLGLTWIVDLLLSARNYHSHGIVSEIEQATHTFANVSKKTSQRTYFIWKEDAKFLEDSKEVSSQDLLPQTQIMVVHEGGISQPYSAIRIHWKKRELPPPLENSTNIK